MKVHHALTFEQEIEWQKNRKLVRSGFKDLEYLPKSRCGWNSTLAAHAFSVRRQIDGSADLNRWAMMHTCPASARYSELGEDALVLWHGTSAARAERIREFGLFHKRGLWTTLEPRIAHGYTRGRSAQYGSGSAMVVILLDRNEVIPGVHYSQEGPNIFRFHCAMPPEKIEYILWDDNIEFMGAEKAKHPGSWNVCRFKKKEGQWVTLSHPPVRFDDDHTYSSMEEWLRLSIMRIISTFEHAAAIEIFSSLYSTIAPWDALRHEDIFDALEQLGCESRSRGKLTQFFISDEDGG